MSDLFIAVEEQPARDTMEAIDEILDRYNREAWSNDYRELTLVLRDSAGRVVGGLHGHTESGWLYVGSLAIQEPHRHGGYGGRLLAAAEAVALERGCHSVNLWTFSFQAPDFYRARGYEVFGELEGYGPHRQIFLRKRLRQDG